MGLGRRLRIAGSAAVVTALLGGCGGLGPLTVQSFVNLDACAPSRAGSSLYIALWTVSWRHGGTVDIRSVRLVPARARSGFRIVHYWAQAPDGEGPKTGQGAGSAVGGSPVNRTGAVIGPGGPEGDFARQVGLRQVTGTRLGLQRVTFAAVIRYGPVGHVRWKGLDVTYTHGGTTRTQRIPPDLVVYSGRTERTAVCPNGAA